LTDIETMILADNISTKVVEIAKKKNGWLKTAAIVLLFVWCSLGSVFINE